VLNAAEYREDLRCWEDFLGHVGRTLCRKVGLNDRALALSRRDEIREQDNDNL
jgi:hypothetical protein